MVHIKRDKHPVEARPRKIILTADRGCRLIIDQEEDDRIVIYEVATRDFQGPLIWGEPRKRQTRGDQQ